MDAQALLHAHAYRSRGYHVHVVGEGGRMEHAMQKGSGRPGDHRGRRDVEECRLAGEAVVPFERSVGVDIVTYPRPGVASQVIG